MANTRPKQRNSFAALSHTGAAPDPDPLATALWCCFVCAELFMLGNRIFAIYPGTGVLCLMLRHIVAVFLNCDVSSQLTSEVRSCGGWPSALFCAGLLLGSFGVMLLMIGSLLVEHDRGISEEYR